MKQLEQGRGFSKGLMACNTALRTMRRCCSYSAFVAVILASAVCGTAPSHIRRHDVSLIEAEEVAPKLVTSEYASSLMKAAEPRLTYCVFRRLTPNHRHCMSFLALACRS